MDVLAYPKTAVAFKIAASHLPPATEKLPLELPINKDEATRQKTYKQNAEKISGLLKQGKNVGFLCEGDCLLYGSFCYLLELLKNEFNVEVVPGVTSFSTAAANLKQPLAIQNEALAIVPNGNPKLAEILKITERAVVIKPTSSTKNIPAGFVAQQYGKGYFSLKIITPLKK